MSAVDELGNGALRMSKKEKKAASPLKSAKLEQGAKRFDWYSATFQAVAVSARRREYDVFPNNVQRSPPTR